MHVPQKQLPFSAPYSTKARALLYAHLNRHPLPPDTLARGAPRTHSHVCRAMPPPPPVTLELRQSTHVLPIRVYTCGTRHGSIHMYCTLYTVVRTVHMQYKYSKVLRVRVHDMVLSGPIMDSSFCFCFCFGCTILACFESFSTRGETCEVMLRRCFCVAQIASS